MSFRPARLFWDSVYAAGDHREFFSARRPTPELAALVAAGAIDRRMTVVDLGCGDGVEARFLAAVAGCRSIGVDLSLTALGLARGEARGPARLPGWLQADTLALPLADTSVDLLLDRGCFHLLPRHRRAAYATEAARVLAPGGRLLLRGAAADDEEAGLVAVDEQEIDRCFPPPQFTRGPLLPITLEAPAGDLAGFLVMMIRGIPPWPRMPAIGNDRA